MQLLTCDVNLLYSRASQSQYLSVQLLGYILHPLSIDSTVLKLISRFSRHFHIPMQTVFPKEWEPLTQLPIKSQEGLLIPKRNITCNQLPIWKKNERFTEARSPNESTLVYFGNLIMTNKGAALKYKHICSRDPDRRLSWLRLLLQPASPHKYILKARALTFPPAAPSLYNHFAQDLGPFSDTVSLQ